MSLNAEETISRLQSSTFRAALKGFIANGLAIVAIFTGSQFDLASVDKWIEFGFLVLPMVYSMLQFKNAMKGRVNAEAKIAPLPWRDEIKSIKKE